MRRRLFQIISALSLVLCAATVALWVCSYAATSSILYGGARESLRSLTDRGLLQIDLRRFNERQPVNLDGIGFSINDYRRSAVWGRAEFDNCVQASALWRPLPYLGFGAHPYISDFFYSTPVRFSWGIFIPLWAVALATAILPLWWGALLHRVRRSDRNHLCRMCGYDLRATPDRCPECGAIPPARVTA